MIRFFARHTGPSLSPFNAWVLSKSLETLSLRVDRHCENALQIAARLEQHPSINWVRYPFLKSHPQFELAKKQMRGAGGMLSFELEGGFTAAVKFMGRLQFCTLAPTLGDVDTLIVHPASMSHMDIPKVEREAVGISDGLIRVSVGIENVKDILKDIEQAID